jgi:serine/threonine protein kinase
MRSPAELSRLSALLDEALELPETEREAWLAKLEDPDQALAPVLLGMLADHALDTRPALLDRGPAFTVPFPDEGIEFLPGDTVGPFRLLRPLGRGGMGEVWLAERDDGQLRRQVALKLPMLAARRSVLAQRFARERDILAALAHPHIARLYDAGVANDGQPYLALEFVEGLTITDHCQAEGLPVRGRVELLLQVLQAVQHAHANLVIHRDLKPSNVLVTSRGQAMLLDFGIAKLLAEDSTQAEETELTRVGGRAMTLDYAAPEQITGAPVSTATDVWALGVLLHELITGDRPFRAERRGEVEQRVLSGDRARLTLPITATGTLRPARLAELDTIVGKALKLEPAQRYATAAALADDLQRWLRDEPVQAQPDSHWYRTSKFVARHRGAVAGSVAVLLAVVGAAGVALWQGQVAREQARIASSEARTSQAVQDFLEGILTVNRSDQSDPIAAREKTARQVLEEAAERVGTSLADAPAAKARVLQTLADMLDNIERRDLALRMLEQRAEVIGQAHGNGGDAHLRALVDVARRLLVQRRPAEARRIVEQALALAASRTDVAPTLSVSLRTLQVMSTPGSDRRATIAMLQQTLQTVPQGPVSQEWLAASVLLSTMLKQGGDTMGAERALRDTLAALPRLNADDLTAPQRLRVELAQRAAAQGQPDEALEQLRRAALVSPPADLLPVLTIKAAASDPDLPRLRLANLEHIHGRYLKLGGSDAEVDFVIESVRQGLVAARVDAGQLDEAASALRQWRRSTERFEQLALRSSATLAIETGEFDKAADAISGWRARIALPERQASPASGSSPRERSINRRVLDQVTHLDLTLSVARGDVDGARSHLARLAGPAGGADGSVDAELAPLEAEIQLLEGRPQDAAATAQRALDRLRIRRAGAPHVRLHQVLGQALLALGRPAEAAVALEQAVQIGPVAYDPAHSPRIAACLGLLAQARLAAGDRPKALESLEQAEKVLARHRRLGPQYTQPVVQARARLPAA